ncbi:MAG: SagB/ThcOx family dehydrogenase [Acidobacteriota bacterium]|nr:SagB/ThcOx family dehydrogenase [Acidobacteriota bacterium]
MRYRRSPQLVAYWAAGRLVCVEYEYRVALTLAPDLIPLLDALDDWRTIDDLARQLDEPREVLEPLVAVLAQARLVRTPDDDGGEVAAAWANWMPSAAYFHFATRDGVFQGEPDWKDPARFDRPADAPPSFRTYAGPRVSLPASRSDDGLAGLLEQRRTHRAFGGRPLEVAELAHVLRLTWTASRRGSSGHWFRTSPSAGARHPIEAYVGVLSVRGLEPGLYHFDSRESALVLRRPGLDRSDVAHWLVGQTWFEHASAVVFMTAVFERTMWRYPSPRAYRSVFLDAGHLAQTFCLAATELDLAPFTTMAFKESRIEHALGLDGRSESVVYVAGIGPRE